MVLYGLRMAVTCVFWSYKMDQYVRGGIVRVPNNQIVG